MDKRSRILDIGLSLALNSEKKKQFLHLVSREDLPAVSPTAWLWEKSDISDVVCVKKDMTGKHSNFVVCPLQSIVYDQMEEASSI